MTISEAPIAKVVTVTESTKFKDVMQMTDTEFLDALETLTTSGDILKNARDIYTYLTMLFEQNCADSLLREWAFQWAASDLGVSYSVIYDKWLSDKDPVPSRP